MSNISDSESAVGRKGKSKKNSTSKPRNTTPEPEYEIKLKNSAADAIFNKEKHMIMLLKMDEVIAMSVKIDHRETWVDMFENFYGITDEPLPSSSTSSNSSVKRR